MIAQAGPSRFRTGSLVQAQGPAAYAQQDPNG